MASFLDLQNGFYNALAQSLGFPPGSPFQLIQPAPPLPAGTNDATLWAYFNNIPPLSLTQNYIASGGNQFFSDYQGVMSALKAPKLNNFQEDIGADCFTAWKAYLNKLTPLPAVGTWPQLFLNWATLNFPDVADTGASDLSAMLDNDIATAQAAVTAYVNPPRVPDWSLGYNDLIRDLPTAPDRHIPNFTSSSANSNVASSWTGGSNSAFFGLWTSSHSDSQISQEFASSNVSLTADFERVTTFVAAPGNWYSSGGFGDAFNHGPAAAPPWNPNATINWENTFGANGNMQRFCGSLVVASGMKIVVTSDATFSKDDQQAIRDNAQAGLWPFYCKSDSSSTHNDASFDQSGRMTITTSSTSGVPIVIGCTVLTAAQFLGHTAQARRRAAR